MKLYGSPTSPYVRKARVLLAEKNLACDFVHEDPWPEDSPIPARNPLGKVPVLDIGDGDYLFESVLVLNYLDQLDGKPLRPANKADSWETQWWEALGQGILDAAVTRVVESRRPAEKQMVEKTAREESRIHRAIAVGEARFKGGEFLVGRTYTLADLVMGVALQYVDFRYPHDWRSKSPKLAKWHAGIVKRKAFQETLPPGFTPTA